MVETKYCSPKCRLFKCIQRAVIYQENKIWCRWTEEDCSIANCSYATCTRRQMLPRGVCGESVKRRTVEIRPEDDTIPPVKLKGKMLRRLGDDELY